MRIGVVSPSASDDVVRLSAWTTALPDLHWVAVPDHATMVASDCDGLVFMDTHLGLLPEFRPLIADHVRLFGIVDKSSLLTRDMIAAADALIELHDLPLVWNRMSKPVMAVTFVPVLFSHDGDAWQDLDVLATEQREMPLILANSFVVTTELGLAAIVVADGDDTYARNSADDLAQYAWDRRAQFVTDDTAIKRQARPMVSQDVNLAWEIGRDDDVCFGYRQPKLS